MENRAQYNLLLAGGEGLAAIKEFISARNVIGTTEAASKTGTLTRTQIDNLTNNIGGSIKSNPLRQEYENAVTGLQNMETSLRNQGLSEEAIARQLSQARRDLGVTYKDATSPELREYIYEVNMGRYNDPLGPSFDDLMVKYLGDYSEIIKAAQKPNPDVDSLLGGFREWLMKKNGY